MRYLGPTFRGPVREGSSRRRPSPLLLTGAGRAEDGESAIARGTSGSCLGHYGGEPTLLCGLGLEFTLEGVRDAEQRIDAPGIEVGA